MAEYDLEVDETMDDMSEIAYVGQFLEQIVTESIDFNEIEHRHGTTRLQLVDSLTLVEQVAKHGTIRIVIGEPVTFDKSLQRHGAFNIVVIDDPISFNELATGYNPIRRLIVQETVGFRERFNYPKKIPTASSEFLSFIEHVHVGFGIKNITIRELLTVGELVYGHASIHTLGISESLSLVDNAYRSHFLSVSDVLVFTESYANEIDVFANQTITFSETLTYQVSKYVHQYLPLYEDVCHKNIFNRTVTETLNLLEHAYRIPDNGELILAWNTLTDAQWSAMSTGQWNSFGIDSTTDNTGIVNIRNNLRLKIKEKLILVENFDEDGGRVHCLIRKAPQIPPQDALNFTQSVGIEIVRAPR